MFPGVNTLTATDVPAHPVVEPQPCGTHGDPWRTKASAVAEFFARVGRLPEAGDCPSELDLAGWLAAQRRAAQQGRITPVHRQHLDERIPGWRQSRQDRWEAQLALFAAAGATPLPRPLNAWLKAQRHAAATGTLRADRKAALDAHAPGWDRTAEQAEQTWLGRAEDLANFVDFSGRFPASSGGTAEAAGLYRWMSYQRALARSGKLTAKRRKWLDKNATGWLPDQNTQDTHWSSRVQALKAFRDREGRWPRIACTAERSLARWLGTQRAASRAGALAPARRAQLEDLSQSWLCARKGG